MSARFNKRRLAAGGFFSLLLFFFTGIPGIINISDADPKTPECASQAHFYANDAPPGSNRFGPELTDQSLEAGQNRFLYKLCSDPAFAATWEDVIVHNLENGTPEWYEARANQFITDRDEWRRAVDAISGSIDRMDVEDRREHYHTLLMAPRGEAVPVIRRTERPVEMGHVLAIHLKDGRTEYARYICDLQPARPEFPGVPPVSVPPPPPPPNTPRVPPTQPPPTVPPTVPPTTPTTQPCVKPEKPASTADFAWEWHPETCQWVQVPNQANNPPDPSDNPGPTPGAPSEPVTPPPGPTPQEGTPPPDPNDTGYDSGSPDGSGTPGGSTTDSSGTTGGGPTPPSGPPVPVDDDTHTSDPGQPTW